MIYEYLPSGLITELGSSYSDFTAPPPQSKSVSVGDSPVLFPLLRIYWRNNKGDIQSGSHWRWERAGS